MIPKGPIYWIAFRASGRRQVAVDAAEGDLVLLADPGRKATIIITIITIIITIITIIITIITIIITIITFITTR